MATDAQATITEVRQLLQDTPSSALCVNAPPVVTVTSGTPVVQAFRTLVENRFSSVPVFDEAAHKVVGYLQLGDLLADIVEFCKIFSGEFDQFKREFGNFQEFLDALSYDRTSDVLTLASRNAYVAVPPETAMLDMLHLLTYNETSRVTLEAGPGNLVGIITQSTIVRMLHHHADIFATVLEGTVAETGFGLKPVFCVKEDQPLLSALELMKAHDLSAVGVTDSEGARLLTTLTTSDMRAVLSRKNFSFFSLTTMEFVLLSRQMSSKDSPALLAAHPDTPLIEVVSRLASSKRHRIFITDAETNAPLGVITVRDILMHLLRHPAFKNV